MPPPTLILASRSPRRARLLTESGYSFQQVQSPFDDPPHPPEGDPATVATDLAQQKARALRDVGSLPERSVILAADTVVLLPDSTLCGTPTCRSAAEAMIRRVLDATHQVITGVALIGADGSEESFADDAEVWVGHLSEQRLTAYLDSGEWRGKAGGYNLFDRLDDGWPIRIAGDPATVVGLPMRLLLPRLDRLGVPRKAPVHEQRSSH